MKSRRSWLPISITDACVAIAAILLGLFIPAWRAAHEASANGTAIPTAEPEEVRRAHNQSGMSIIVPVNWWESKLHSDRDAHGIAFSGGGRFHSTIFAERVGEDFDDSAFGQSTDFDGQSVRTSTHKKSDSTPKGRYFIYQILATYNETRYHLGYESREDINTIPPIVVRYLQTFRPVRNAT